MFDSIRKQELFFLLLLGNHHLDLLFKVVRILNFQMQWNATRVCPSLTCSPSCMADRRSGMQTALRLSFNSFPLSMSMPMHPSSCPLQGRLLFPQSAVLFSWVKVMSWSKNWPHVIVTWVKFGVMLSSLPVELTNTIVLMFLAFGSDSLFDPSVRGAYVPSS